MNSTSLMGGSRLFTRVLQIGIVVRNVQASAKIYADEYGIGPWVFYDLNPSNVENMQVNGQTQAFAMRLALADLGGIELELIQPLDNHSIYAAFLEAKGEGIHHLAFDTASYDQAVAFLANKDISILQTGTWQNETFSYFDTSKDLALISEIYKRSSAFEAPDPVMIYPEKL